MKKLIALLLVTVSATAMAQHRPYPHHHHHPGGHGWGWIAPALIGGAVVYAATRPPVVLQQPPVVVQQPTDIVYIDGIAYRKQWIVVNGAYQEVLIRI
jgi:hypothetical protein